MTLAVALGLALSSGPILGQDTEPLLSGNRVRLLTKDNLELRGVLLQLGDGTLKLASDETRAAVMLRLESIRCLQVHRGWERRFGIGQSMLVGALAGVALAIISSPLDSSREDTWETQAVGLAQLGLMTGLAVSITAWNQRWEDVALPPSGGLGSESHIEITMSAPLSR